MKNSSSSEQLDADGDSNSEVSSEVSFSYEFAQTEVMMKALGNNGEEKGMERGRGQGRWEERGCLADLCSPDGSPLGWAGPRGLVGGALMEGASLHSSPGGSCKEDWEQMVRAKKDSFGGEGKV